MTTTYAITQPETGVLLGIYAADSEAAALDAMARDAGYTDYASIPDDDPKPLSVVAVDTPEPVVVGGHAYTASLSGSDVTIYRDGVLAGSGWWGGRIQDCPADLGDDVYDLLDRAIEAAIREAR